MILSVTLAYLTLPCHNLNYLNKKIKSTTLLSVMKATTPMVAFLVLIFLPVSFWMFVSQNTYSFQGHVLTSSQAR